MAFDTYPAHYLLQWGGRLHDAEIWSNSVRLVQNTTAPPGQLISPEALQTFLAEFETELAAFVTSGLFHNGVFATYAKCNAIAPNGKYVSDTQSNSRFFGVPSQGVATRALAPQLSMAVTLLTNTQRGLANKGRFFLAGLSGDLFTTSSATGRCSAGVAGSVSNNVQTFLNAINNNPGFDAEFGGLDVHVVSQGNLFGNGVARKVTGVKVGTVLDTQRRRRNNLLEEYSAPAAIS